LLLIPALLGLWLLVTSLAEVVPGLGLYDGKRFLELYLIAVTLSLTLLSTRARHHAAAILSAFPSWVRILLIVFFGLGFISALLTPNPAYPLVDVAMLFLLILTAISVACARQLSGHNFDRVALILLALMGLGIVLQELSGLLVYLSTEQQFNYREALFHFIHPRLYNQVQTWTIPLLALLPLAFSTYRWTGRLSIFLIGSQWYILLSTGARGSTISLLLALTVVGLVLPETRKFWIRTHVWGLLLGVLFYLTAIGLLQAVQPDRTDFVSESIGRPMLHTSGRIDLWQHAIDDAIENPLLGAGPMRYACGAEHYLAGSPHSFPFQIMGEWGIPAFLILAVVFGWLVYSWFLAIRPIRRSPDYQQALTGCLSISCLAAVIHVCVSGLLIAPSSQVAGMLVTGWLLGCLFKNNNADSKRGTSWHDGPFLLLLALAVSVSVLLFSTAELKEMSFRTSYAQDFGPTTPRYWQDGRFCEYSF